MDQKKTHNKMGGGKLEQGKNSLFRNTNVVKQVENGV